MSSVYDDLIGLADRDGLLLYSLRSHTVRRSDLDLNEPAVVLDPANPAIAHRYRRLLALSVAVWRPIPFSIKTRSGRGRNLGPNCDRLPTPSFSVRHRV
jgi:hypothetical protein